MGGPAQNSDLSDLCKGTTDAPCNPEMSCWHRHICSERCYGCPFLQMSRAWSELWRAIVLEFLGPCRHRRQREIEVRRKSYMPERSSRYMKVRSNSAREHRPLPSHPNSKPRPTMCYFSFPRYICTRCDQIISEGSMKFVSDTRTAQRLSTNFALQNDCNESTCKISQKHREDFHDCEARCRNQ